MSAQIYWTSSSALLRETRIEGFLTNIEPLRIGSGREPPLGALTDLAVLRIKYGEHEFPYIPGSSLKGVFRSYATAIAKTKGMRVCTGLSKETCMDIEEVEDPELGKLRLGDLIEIKLRHGESKEAMEYFWKHACLMCKIFGSPSYRGKISFSDTYPMDEQENELPVRTGIRTGIAINRKTGAVMEHAFYTVEYVEPGARFRFNIYCTNLPNYVLGLIGVVLRMLHAGKIKIGGFKSRGFGRVKIEKLSFMNKDFPVNTTAVMKSLEKDVDKEIALHNFVRIEDGWLVAQDDNAWELLERLEGIWNNVSSKG